MGLAVLLRTCLFLLVLRTITCTHLGIQVSSDDGIIDWQVVRHKNLPNIVFAMIRGSEGQDMDPNFQYNFEQAREQDIFQTKYVHVFRTQERDNSSGVFRLRDVSVASQVQRIKKMMQLVNFSTTGSPNRYKDELVIRVQQIPGDPGLNGGLPNSRLFSRIEDLMGQVRELGVKPIIQTEKQFWDNFVYAGEPLDNNITETLCLDHLQPEDRINSIPLAICSCAVVPFAPLAKGTIAALPLGLDVYSGGDADMSDESGNYYWHFSDSQTLNGIKGLVSLVMKVYPFQRPRLHCEWSEQGAEKPYPTYPIPSNYTGDHWRRGIPHDEYSRRCRVQFANPFGLAIPALMAVMIG